MMDSEFMKPVRNSDDDEETDSLLLQSNLEYSQVEGRSHLTARMHASHLSTFCQRSSWLSSLVVKQVSLINDFFRRKGPLTPFLTG